jgi:hypothetical protein
VPIPAARKAGRAVEREALAAVQRAAPRAARKPAELRQAS